MDLLTKYLEIVLEWLLPIFKVAAVGTAAGVAAMGFTERLVPTKFRSPDKMRMIATFLTGGIAWAINYSDMLGGFGTGPKSWALVMVATAFGSFISERVHDSPPPGLQWLKKQPVGGE